MPPSQRPLKIKRDINESGRQWFLKRPFQTSDLAGLGIRKVSCPRGGLEPQWLEHERDWRLGLCTEQGMEGSRIPVSLDNPPVHFLMIAYTGISQSFKGLRVWSLERIIISIIQNRRRRVPARGENKNKNVARSRKQTPTLSLVHILFLRFPQCPHCMVLSPKRVRVARWEYMQTARCSEQKFRVHSDVHGRHTSPCRTVGLTPHFPHTVGLMPHLPVTQ